MLVGLVGEVEIFEVCSSSGLVPMATLSLFLLFCCGIWKGSLFPAMKKN